MVGVPTPTPPMVVIASVRTVFSPRPRILGGTVFKLVSEIVNAFVDFAINAPITPREAK